MERKLVGIPASPGIAVGPVHLLRWEVPDVPHRIIPDEAVPAELERFRKALESAWRWRKAAAQEGSLPPIRLTE